EYEFIDTLWPDFSKEEFGKLCASFGCRDRRFGAVKP
ncbi:MAG: undecaprenyl diphosphate synthase, partial [Sulfitobacter sp.]